MTQNSLHLLIVEDVWEDAKLITEALASAGIKISYDNVETESECKELLKSNKYHAVLSDYRLPGCNGSGIFETLQESGQDIPFILITGSLGEEAAVECIKAGMTDYVLKDRLFRLPSVLKRALQEFELRRQKQAAIAQLEQQAQKEAIINRILQAMRETLVLEEVFQITLDQLHQALDVSRCIFSQPTDNYFEVRYVSNFTPEREQLFGLRCDLCQHYEKSLRNGEAIVIYQFDEEVSSSVKQAARQLNIHSCMIVPLMYRQSHLGVIQLLQCDRQRKWTEIELDLVKAISDQCAIAIHQAELYQKAQSELTERKRIEAQLRYDALHDALTGLANRALLMDRLDHLLKMTQRRHSRLGNDYPYLFAVLFLDLDRFKVVNDSLGHLAGDRLLQQVARCLESCLRIGDTVARLGGDEFVILVEDITSVNDAIEIANRFHQVLGSPFILNGQEIFITGSIGITLSNSEYDQPSQLLRDADTAMYRAKNRGGGCYEVFDNSMHAQALKRLNLENNLRRAIERQELIVFYQPIISLLTNRIIGFEALVRWQHPKEGLIPPGEFIPVAEETGLISSIDLWVLEESCRQLCIWQKEFSALMPLSMSVNLSGKQFSQPNLIAQIDRILEDTQVQGQFIKLEITESVLIHNAVSAAEILTQLRKRDIVVCVDDFGTGYSSLGYLHNFPIEILKIDRSFIMNLKDDSENSEIVRAIVSLGLNLSLNVVAEGIETQQQCLFLKKIGCHSGQGYWFHPPLPEESVTRILSQTPPINLKA